METLLLTFEAFPLVEKAWQFVQKERNVQRLEKGKPSLLNAMDFQLLNKGVIFG